MIKIEDTIAYYDKVSSTYSKTRYEGKTQSYVQFSFRERLNIGISLLKRVLPELQGKSLLEIGCADGPVMRRIYAEFPNVFSRYVGTDISPEMIRVSTRENKIPNATYHLVGEEPKLQHGLVVKLGVHSDNTLEEMESISNMIAPGGYYLYAVSAPSSLFSRIKMPNKEAVQTYLRYDEYPKLFSTHFEIIKRIPCGFFVPKLWSIPPLARVLQPVIEVLFRFLPTLYHEHVYLLKKKTK